MRLTYLRIILFLFAAIVACESLGLAATHGTSQWVVILKEPPAVQKYPGRIENTRAVSEPYRAHLRQMQANLRPQIESTHARVTGSLQHLLNGILVAATPEQAAALRKLPGVATVMHVRRYHKADQLTLSDVAGAWNVAAVGGESKAGAGVKIGILDTGIDQTHPAFNDSGFTAPSGYPKCDVPANCAFTNKKVIVARSYVSDIILGDQLSASTSAASVSRPDDVTARDLDGHGTGVASVAAGVTTSYNGIQITGVAPKAYLGNYKIFGSDDVNPNGSGNILQALEDAVTDGMDVVNMSFGSSASADQGPLDEGCGPYTLPNSPIPIASDACDPFAYEVESAMQSALVTVVVAAGNSGSNGYQFNLACGSPPCQNYSTPTFATIGSPAYAPSAIAVGGIQNDVTYVQQVEVSGSVVPSNVKAIAAYESYDGPPPLEPLTATLVDATKVGDADGLLCNAVAPTALTGEIVLVLQGSCTDLVKVTNAQNAGAVGVIEIADTASFFFPFGLAGTKIPTFILTPDDGANLKSYVDANSGAKGTMDPRPFQVPADSQGLLPYSIAYFSSRGPSPATGALKPDLVAAGTDFLMPTESYDPYGELFNFSRYGAQDGTSFATPMVTGSAALVKQANPAFTPLQVRSALVNTAALANLTTSDGNAQASISEAGAGLLQAQNAVVSTVQVVPATISFGSAGTTLVSSQTLTFYNTASSSVTLAMNVVPSAGFSTSSTQVQINNSSTPSVKVPGATGSTPGSATVTATLTGSLPPAGRYEGVVTVSGGPVALTIPYMFVATDGVPYDVIPLNDQAPGQGISAFDGVVGAQMPCVTTVPPNSCLNDYGPVAIQVIDQYGVPVAGVPVVWTPTQGGGTVDPNYSDFATDANGVASATVYMGATPGAQEFTATVPGTSLVMTFDGYAREAPAINANGVVDGASFTGGKAVAPGSWISVFGTNMSDTTQGANGVDLAFALCPLCNPVTQALPMGIDGASFSFDTSSQSLPGRMNYVSPTQLNLQVPWELQGQTSATVKVIVNYTYSAVYTLPLAEYSPGFFVLDSANDAAALDLSYKVIGSSNPVARGSVVQLFMNGLGPVSNQPGDGVGAPSATLAKSPVNPTITIGGQNASVQFSGLAPGYVSLYQVNAVVPAGISTGAQSITCSIGGVTCKTAQIFVK